MADVKYEVNGVPLDGIRNRNEGRVIKLLPGLLAERPDYEPSYLDIQDIYALALNNLQARYAQSGSIVLHEPVSDADLIREVSRAIETVRHSPTMAGD